MSKQRTTPEMRTELRRRYLDLPDAVLPCLECDATMVLDPPQRHKMCVVWNWRCPRSPEHPPLRHTDYFADLDVIAAVDDADDLAAAWERVVTLERALREIRSEAYYGLERQREAGVLLTIEGMTRRALGLQMAPWTLESDDTPGGSGL
jgi:hypothetical protein